MADAITEASEAIKARLEELLEEQDQLQNALKYLTDTAAPRKRAQKRRSDGRKKDSGRGQGRSKTTKPKVRRAKSSTARAPRGQRRDQFIAAVKENPGQTVSEISRAIGISPNQGQAVARKARAERLVRKRGKKYFPTK